jgi:hypothetical protein
MNTLGSGYKMFCSRWWKHWLSPQTYYYWLKYKIQRAQRGWADCDTWSLDNYLAEWLPAALRHLKEHQHGFPASMFDENDSNEENNYCASEEAYDRATAKWDSILQTMIEGFEAFNRTDGLFVDACLYEYELGPYPLDPDWPNNINKPRSEEQKLRYAHAQELEARDMQKFKDGMVLFTEYFQNLWD